MIFKKLKKVLEKNENKSTPIFLFFWITIKKKYRKRNHKNERKKEKTNLNSGAKPLGGDPSVCMVSKHP